jgi:hypothetical protein
LCAVAIVDWTARRPRRYASCWIESEGWGDREQSLVSGFHLGHVFQFADSRIRSLKEYIDRSEVSVAFSMPRFKAGVAAFVVLCVGILCGFKGASLGAAAGEASHSGCIAGNAPTGRAVECHESSDNDERMRAHVVPPRGYFLTGRSTANVLNSE